MSRFTQYSEDSTRLPVGLQRIAYDADTQQYTFRDENGRLYYSASGESYGHLTSAGNGSAARAGEAARNNTPSTEPKPKRSPTSRSSPSLPAPKSFYDILPPESIASAGSTASLKSSPFSFSPTSPSSPSSSRTSPSSPSSSPTSPSSSSPRSTPSPRSRFIAAAKRSTMPRMQSVVHGLMKRSVTLGKKQGNQTRTYPSGHHGQGDDEDEDDRAGLLRTHSVVSRSSTVRTSQSSGVTLVEETGEGY